jgi:hypothetical protein
LFLPGSLGNKPIRHSQRDYGAGQIPLPEKGRHEFADSPRTIPLFKNDYLLILLRKIPKKLFIQRLYEAEIRHSGKREILVRTNLPGLQSQRQSASETQKHRTFSLSKNFPPSPGERILAFSASKSFRGISPRIAHQHGAILRKSVGEEEVQIHFIPGSRHGDVGNAPGPGKVEKAVMGLSVFSYKPRPIHPQQYGKFLHGHVMYELIHGSLEEGGVDAYRRSHSSRRHSRGKGKHVFLRNTHIEEASGISFFELPQFGSLLHGCGKTDDAGIFFGHLHKGSGGRGAPASQIRRRTLFFRFSHSVVLGGVIFCGNVALSLFRNHVKQEGPMVLHGEVEDSLELLHVVPVERPPIAEIQLLEEVGGLKKGFYVRFEAPQNFFKPLSLGEVSALLFHGLLELAIKRGGA